VCTKNSAVPKRRRSKEFSRGNSWARGHPGKFWKMRAKTGGYGRRREFLTGRAFAVAGHVCENRAKGFAQR